MATDSSLYFGLQFTDKTKDALSGIRKNLNDVEKQLDNIEKRYGEVSKTIGKMDPGLRSTKNAQENSKTIEEILEKGKKLRSILEEFNGQQRKSKKKIDEIKGALAEVEGDLQKAERNLKSTERTAKNYLKTHQRIAESAKKASDATDKLAESEKEAAKVSAETAVEKEKSAKAAEREAQATQKLATASKQALDQLKKRDIDDNKRRLTDVDKKLSRYSGNKEAENLRKRVSEALTSEDILTDNEKSFALIKEVLNLEKKIQNENAGTLSVKKEELKTEDELTAKVAENAEAAKKVSENVSKANQVEKELAEKTEEVINKEEKSAEASEKKAATKKMAKEEAIGEAYAAEQSALSEEKAADAAEKKSESTKKATDEKVKEKEATDEVAKSEEKAVSAEERKADATKKSADESKKKAADETKAADAAEKTVVSEKEALKIISEYTEKEKAKLKAKLDAEKEDKKATSEARAELAIKNQLLSVEKKILAAKEARAKLEALAKTSGVVDAIEKSDKNISDYETNKTALESLEGEKSVSNKILEIRKKITEADIEQAQIRSVIKSETESQKAIDGQIERNLRVREDINRQILKIDEKRAELAESMSNGTYSSSSLSKVETLDARIEEHKSILKSLLGQEDAEERIKELQARTNTLLKNTANIQKNINQEKKNGEKYAAGLERSARSTLAIFNNLEPPLRRIPPILSEATSRLRMMVSLMGIGGFLKSVIQTGGEFEKQKIALQNIVGSITKANNLYGRIQTLAVESPFSFKELITYTKQLSAYQIKSGDLYDTTKRLADLSAGLGVSMDRLILAYGQVRSASVLRGQELRQFTEAGIPMVQALADKFTKLNGKATSTADVFKLISKRAVPFKMVKEVLEDMTNEGGQFYKMQETLSQTLSGSWSNLGDRWDMFLAQLAKGEGAFGKVLKTAVDGITAVTDVLQRNALAVVGTLTALIVKANHIKISSLVNPNNLSKKYDRMMVARNKENVYRQIRGESIIEGDMLTKQETARYVMAGKINNAELRVLHAKKLINTETVKHLVKLRLIEAHEGAIIVKTTKLQAAWLGVRSAMSGVWSFLKSSVWMLVLEGLMVAGSKVLDYFARIDDMAKKVVETANEATRKGRALLDVLEATDSAKKNTKELAEQVKELEKYLKGSSSAGQDMINQVDGTKDLAEKYRILKGNVKDVAKQLSIVAAYAKEIAEIADNNQDSWFTELFRSTSRREKHLNNSWGAHYDKLYHLSYDNTTTKQMKEVAKNVAKLLGDDKTNIDKYNSNMSLSNLLVSYYDKTAKYRKQAGLNGTGATKEERDLVKKIDKELAKLPSGIIDASREFSAFKKVTFNKGTERANELKKAMGVRFNDQGLRDAEVTALIETVRTAYGNDDAAREWLKGFNKALGTKYSLLEQDEKGTDEPDGDGGDDGKKGEDTELAEAKRRLTMIKELISKYKELFGVYKDTETAFSEIKKIPNLLQYAEEYEGLLKQRDYAEILNDQKKYFPAPQKGRNNARAAALTSLETDIAEEGGKRAVEESEKAAELFRERLQRIKNDYENFRKFIKNTSDPSLAKSLFRYDMGDAENYVEYLRKQLKDKNISDEIVNSFLFAEDSTIEEYFNGTFDEATILMKELKTATEEYTKSSLESWLEFIEAAKDYNAELKEIDDWEKRMKKQGGENGASQEQLDAVTKQANEKRAKVNFEQFKKDSDWANIFGNLKFMSESAISTLLSKIRDKQVSGEFNGLDPSDMKSLVEAIEKLRDEMYKRNPFGTISGSITKAMRLRSILSFMPGDTYKAGITPGLTYNAAGLTPGKEYTKDELRALLASEESAFVTAIEQVSSAFDALKKVIEPVTNLFGTLNMTTSDVTEAMDIIGGGFSSVSGTAGAFTSLKGLFKEGSGISDALGAAGPWAAAASGALSITNSILELHDKAIEKEIEASKQRQKEMENLYSRLKGTLERTLGSVYSFEANQIALEKLNKTTGKSYNSAATSNAVAQANYSRSYYDTAFASLNAQADEKRHQIEEEYAKKKTDKTRISDFQEELASLEEQIANFASEMAKSLYSIDFQNWASQLSSAIVSAWQNGTDAALAYKNTVSDLIRNVAQSAIQYSIIEKAIEPIAQNFLSEFENADGKMNDRLYDILGELYYTAYNVSNQADATLDEIEQRLKAKYGVSIKGSSNSSGLSASISNITESQAELLGSYLNAMRADLSEHKYHLKSLCDEQMPTVINSLAIQTVKLESIRVNTGRNADAAEEIYGVLRGMTNGTYKITVS